MALSKNSIFALIISSLDSYRYEVIGTASGAYGLTVSFFRQEHEATFVAVEIPINAGSVHTYVIDWELLAEGGEGVILEKDEEFKDFINDPYLQYARKNKKECKK